MSSPTGMYLISHLKSWTFASCPKLVSFGMQHGQARGISHDIFHAGSIVRMRLAKN
jgi:hypothetical protein